MKYTVELTGHEKHWAIIDEEKDKEFTVHEMYDSNTDWSSFVVYDEEGETITGKLADEILKACQEEAQNKKE